MPFPQPPQSPPRQRRHRRWPWVVGVLAILILMANCGGNDTPPAPASAPAPSATTAPGLPHYTPTPTTTTTTAPTTAPAVPANAVQVTRVIDGDTFEVTGGRTIRVLGIDSCEANTYGGQQATAAASMKLAGKTVTLTAEPTGDDRDRYDRELRYVQVGGSDFGSAMVRATHTSVYAGDNDASAAYVSDLRAMDTNGRTCAAPATTEGDTYVNVPDGDDDGGESRFCRGRAWC
jgi:micrococcal nuclease